MEEEGGLPPGVQRVGGKARDSGRVAEDAEDGPILRRRRTACTVTALVTPRYSSTCACMVTVRLFRRRRIGPSVGIFPTRQNHRALPQLGCNTPGVTPLPSNFSAPARFDTPPSGAIFRDERSLPSAETYDSSADLACHLEPPSLPPCSNRASRVAGHRLGA